MNSTFKDILRKEGCFEIFEYKGFKCCIVREMPLGCWNGYVAVDKRHPLWGVNYDSKFFISKEVKKLKEASECLPLLALLGKDDDVYSLDSIIDVHGGLTYSNFYLRGYELFDKYELWWFGFDTCHYTDLCPFKDNPNGIYRNKEYVLKETRKLVDQLSNIGLWDKFVRW